MIGGHDLRGFGGRPAIADPTGEDRREHSALSSRTEYLDPIAGPEDALKTESLRPLHAVWPALLDALQPLLDEIVHDRGELWSPAGLIRQLEHAASGCGSGAKLIECLEHPDSLTDAEYSFLVCTATYRQPTREDVATIERIHARVVQP